MPRRATAREDYAKLATEVLAQMPTVQTARVALNDRGRAQVVASEAAIL